MPDIRLTISDELLDALRSGCSVTLNVVTAPNSRRRARSPRAGSLPARILDWAAKRKRPFHTLDVERRFKVSRAHASMLLSRLASSPLPVKRVDRGEYAHQ